MKENYQILVIGSVKSTAQTIKSLLLHDFNIVGVLGFEPERTNQVSGWYNLKKLALDNKIDFKDFVKVNQKECIEWAKEKRPDIIFAVGFSQLLNEDWFHIPKLGIIGFHPTSLPKGRGRAPLAWAILEERSASAPFFLLEEGADSGPIFIQELIQLSEDDDASSLEKKIIAAIKVSLRKWLPKLKAGIWNPKPQNEKDASWYGRRTRFDGLINWNESAEKIDLLIKASTRPHPGAFTFHKNSLVTIHRSSIEKKIPIKGTVGRVLLISKKKGYLIQCGVGLLWINKIDIDNRLILSVGHKLGYYIEYEIYKIWKKLNKHD